MFLVLQRILKKTITPRVQTWKRDHKKRLSSKRIIKREGEKKMNNDRDAKRVKQ
jgi:hypothetical protein